MSTMHHDLIDWQRCLRCCCNRPCIALCEDIHLKCNEVRQERGLLYCSLLALAGCGKLFVMLSPPHQVQDSVWVLQRCLQSLWPVRPKKRLDYPEILAGCTVCEGHIQD